jgi:hypothetical protein
LLARVRRASASPRRNAIATLWAANASLAGDELRVRSACKGMEAAVGFLLQEVG